MAGIRGNDENHWLRRTAKYAIIVNLIIISKYKKKTFELVWLHNFDFGIGKLAITEQYGCRWNSKMTEMEKETIEIEYIDMQFKVEISCKYQSSLSWLDSNRWPRHTHIASNFYVQCVK